MPRHATPHRVGSGDATAVARVASGMWSLDPKLHSSSLDLATTVSHIPSEFSAHQPHEPHLGATRALPTMGLFSSSSPPPASTDPPLRSARDKCYAARDAFFACLDAHMIVDALADPAAVDKVCGRQDQTLQRDCAQSWVRGLLDLSFHACPQMAFTRY